MDFQLRRTSIFNPDGEFLKSFQWKGFYLRLLLVTDSSLTTTENTYGPERKLFVKTLDFAGNEIVNWGEFKALEIKMAKVGKMTLAVPSPFTPQSVFTGDQQHQWLYHCFNNTYAIEVYDAAGKLFRKIDRPYQPVPFTEKDAEKFRAQLLNFPNKEFADAIIKKVTYPSVKTITSYLVVDELGNLWVRTNEEKQQDDVKYTAYDIFNSDGYYDARVWIDVSPRIFLNGKMYTVHRDKETDLRTVKRYRVVWSEGT